MIISKVVVCISAYKKPSVAHATINAYFDLRKQMLADLGLPYTEPSPNQHWWFYENYLFESSEIRRLQDVWAKYREELGDESDDVSMEIDWLNDFVSEGEIKLSDKVYVSDPTYGFYEDSYCASSIKDVLPGVYLCSVQKTGTGCIASIKVVHTDYLDKEKKYDFNEPAECEYIGVDSGTCGIFDYQYKKKQRDWSSIITKDVEIFDYRAFISRTGFGDGSYFCYVMRNEEEKVVGIRVVYIDGEDIGIV